MQGKAAIITLLCGITLMSPLVYTQDSQPAPKPLPPSQTTGVGAQLIVWSEVQKPKPIEGQQRSPAVAPTAGQSEEGSAQPSKAATPNARPTAQAANNAGSLSVTQVIDSESH